MNAINGPDSLDVYVDQVLAVAALDSGGVSQPLMLADQPEHSIQLFEAIAAPPRAVGARVDAPVEGWSHTGMPAPEKMYHPDRPSALRLANTSAGGRWYVFTTPLGSSFECTAGFAGFDLSSSADVFSGAMKSSGVGVFGTSTGGSIVSKPFDYVVTVAGRPPTNDFVPPFQFGSFEFGKVRFELEQYVKYIAFGNDGVYGAAELVFDCATDRIVSTRAAERNPTFPSSRFVPVEPDRLFDTRTAEAPAGALTAGSTIDVEVTGEVGVPSTGVTAVVLNVTATQSQQAGFVTVFPKGSAQPSTSSLNVSGPNQTVPNLVVVPVGDDGEVSFYTKGGLHLFADVAGYFVSAQSSTDGRFVPLSPDRVFDTREPAAPAGVVRADQTISVQIAGKQGVPATGAAAVVLNLTGVGVAGPGFVTAFPHGTDRPLASNVNLSGAGDIAPNLVMVPLGEDGKVDFYAKSDVHLLADVFGYFTDDSASSSTSGLFVPTSPVRFDDSRLRPWEPTGFGSNFIEADDTADVEIAGFADVPVAGAGAVLANVTVTETAAGGFLTVWPEGEPRPGTSNLNATGANVTRPNAVVVPLGDDGNISLYSKSGSHAIVDVSGYFTE